MSKVKEFASALEKVMPAEELLLKGAPGFGKWKRFFPQEAVEHPAKANLNLLRFLIERYTSPKDTVCDPMAGTGSTGLLAALSGRNAVQVELEERFFGFMERARENLEKHISLSPKGAIRNILGDARNLSRLLQDRSDIVITSPPYSDSISRQGGATALKPIGVSSKTAREYSESPQNIGNLQHGDVDAVITSPPYGQAQEGGGIFKEGYMRVEEGKIISDPDLPFRHGRPVNPENPANIDNLPYVDTIITSPPYEAAVSDDKEGPGVGANEEKYGRWRKGTAKRHSYTQHGESSKVDVVITSPPYEEGIGHGGGDDTILKEKHIYLKGKGSYSEDKENIGNLKEETYLEAMLQVYRECFKILKAGGLCIIIVKAFIRDFKMVDLPYHTWLLLKEVGFKLEKVYKLRLRNAAFFRILYYKKYPEVGQIRHEHVLIVRK